MLSWLKIGSLVVNRAYQRDVRRAGRKNVEAIARNFRWSKFAPVVVAPIEGGHYAIVDGQHRTTAAALCGFDQVPCQIVVADQAGQAEAFAAINGQVTPISRVALHRARKESGDVEALAIEAVAKAGDATVVDYVKPTMQMKAGETLAVGTIAKMLRTYGHDHVVTALQCITRTGDGNPGLLVSTTIKGFCIALDRAPSWRESGGRLLKALDDFDILSTFDECSTGGRRVGMAGFERFALAVNRHLADREQVAA